jgi:predicted transcriptional regulator
MDDHQRCHGAEPVFLGFSSIDDHQDEKMLDIYWPGSRIAGRNYWSSSNKGFSMSDPQPTERELEALKVLWDRGEATVRDICDALNQRGVELAYTTVLSLLQVMEQKGLVTHRRDGKAYAYAATIERGRTFRELASGFLERVFDGAVDEYLVHALQSRPMKPEELDELEAMIAKARERSKSENPPP